MLIDAAQMAAAARRYHDREAIRDRNKRMIASGDALTVDDPRRVAMFLSRRGLSLAVDGISLTRPDQAGAGSELATLTPVDALERIMGTNDLLGVAFLEQGLRVARTVARVWVGVSAGRPAGYGTGFLISPRLLLTNNHVFQDAATARASLVEFDYAISADGQPKHSAIFATDPDTFFATDPDLDYSIVALAATSRDNRPLSHFGWNPLVEQEGKAITGQYANIIQHPGGEYKQLAFRQNLIVDVLENFLHYESDTVPGSSGSPVFNDRWEVVALHHSSIPARNAAGELVAIDGTPWRPEMGEQRIRWKANEGARISRVVKHLRATGLDATRRALIEQALSDERPSWEQSVSVPSAPPAPGTGASVSVSPDGTATWTIPLNVTIGIGGATAAAVSQTAAAVAPAPTPPPAGASVAGVSPNSPDAIVEAARNELGARQDVLGVRLGWLFKDGWITDERALVVTVPRKLTPAAMGESGISTLPASYRGLPVQIVEPTIEEMLRRSPEGPATEAFVRDLGTLAQEIAYVKPTGVSLAPVQEQMRLQAHVSPDGGWPQLRDFLAGTRRELIIGMYDFGAPHIVTAIEALDQIPTFRSLSLAIQPGESVGSGTKKDDLKDKEVVDRFAATFGARFHNAWVKVGSVSGWVASSYHIKVAVRDGKAFWLSSGNWQSSNQPAVDPIAEQPQRRTWLESHNRDWHVVVENAKLARTFGKLLQHDFDANRNFVPGQESLPVILVPEEAFLPSAAERTRPFAYFPPFDDNRTFSVEPLLTPDNYHERVLAFVSEAEEELLIQNQTFNAPKAAHAKLRELMEGVLERKRRGVEIKIIFRILMASDARKNLEALKDFGFDQNDIKVQKNCHTKGIIVDRKAVLIGSQNWSNLGVSDNRDASLLVRDPALAEYYSGIFDHDWANIAERRIGQAGGGGHEIAPAGTAPQAGYVALDWKDWAEML